MNTRNDAAKTVAELESELQTYKTYLAVLDEVTSSLLEGEETVYADVLRLITDISKADVSLIYLTQQDVAQREIAELAGVWTVQGAPPQDWPGHAQLARMAYDDYPALGDALRIGMIVNKPVVDLSYPEQMLFAPLKAAGILCVPLLVKGELQGFIALFCKDEPRRWKPLDVRLITAISHDVAMSAGRQRIEKDLRANQRRLQTLVGATEDMVFEYDSEGVIRNVWSTHPYMPAMDLRGLSLDKAMPGEMAQAFQACTDSVLRSEASETVEFAVHFMHDVRYFSGRLQSVPAEVGNSRNIVALVRDVTGDIQDEARRKTLLDTLNLLEEAIIDLSISGELQTASSAWAKIRKISPQEQASDYGKPLVDWIFIDDRDRLVTALQRLVKGGQSDETVRFRLAQQGDQQVWIEARLMAHRVPGIGVGGIRGVLRDVTAAYLHEERITQLALYDSLTQLPNRILLDDHLQLAIQRAQRQNTRVALGFIDLDHFKQINDTFGHKAGDEVLCNLARTLKSTLRDVDTLARWGGDEFVVLLPDLSTTQSLRGIAERLREIARQGVMIEGLETKPSISVGIAVFPDDAKSAEALLSAADHTMYYAKTAGRNNVQFYSEVMHNKAQDREHVVIQSRLSSVIQEAGLQVFYQPIVNSRTGQISSVEALTRWHDEKNGWVSPGVFIPMAEKLGLIQELGEQVMDQAFRRLRAWREAGYTQKVAINVSRTQLFNATFVPRVLELLTFHRLKPEDIILEITESVALTDYSRQSKHLKELAQAGFAIAIDDFGTGYSALSQLHEMPANIIKIDTSFTQRLHTEEGRRVVQAIVQMAHALGMDVVVEGVEKMDIATYLRGLGVEKMQGHYFSEPVPAGVCELMLRHGFKIST